MARTGVSTSLRTLGHLVWTMVVLAACITTPGAAGAEQYRWSNVARIVAVSDPHGAYDALLKTLENAAVIDASGRWAGGQTHLVITGDLLDRGADSRKVMDLVMALEAEAVETGGMVHLTLGNHEVMNLVGDLRYVAAEEYAAFAAEESEAERQRWFRKFSAGHEAADELTVREEFDRDRPTGFYAHRAAFARDGYYGKWLLSKPVMVVINNTAFVHGGLPPLVAEFNLDSLNKVLRTELADYVSQSEILIDGGYLDPALNFYSHSDVAELLLADGAIPSDIRAASSAIIELSGARIHGGNSPLWYRGSVGCSTVIEDSTLRDALDAIDADRVVIGHTPTLTRQVLQKHQGRVLEIDTGMLHAAYRGSGFALIIENDELTVASQQSTERSTPLMHPRRVGWRPAGMLAADLERLLASGDMLARGKNAAGQEIVELAVGEQKISAIFTPNPRNREFSPSLASYRLDRMLGLDMVPLTVAREIDGRKGALQYLPERVRDEGERSASGSGSDAWCSLPKQWNAMYIFDTLIYNTGRPQSDMLYSLDNWQLLLSGNKNTFDSKRDKPKYLRDAPLNLDQSWVAAIASLTDERLAENIADVLDNRRLKALTQRRDLLLKEANSN